MVAPQRLDPVGDEDGADVRVRAPVPERPEEEEERRQQGEQLEPVVERLHEGDAAHAAGEDVEAHDDRDGQLAHPRRRPGEGAQGQAGALELRDEVEQPDRDDEQARGSPRHDGLEPQLGEVGQRVGARPAQRRGDEDEQQEVARGPADRQPQHVHAAGQDEPGDPEERCGREVLAADGRGVEHRAHAARGDVEVAHRAREPQPEGADGEGRERHQDDGDDAGGVAHRSRTPLTGRRAGR